MLWRDWSSDVCSSDLAARACQVEACAGPLCGSPDSAMYHVECNRDMFAEQPSMPWTLALCWCEWTGIYLVGAACSRRETGSRPHSCWHPRHNLFHFARGVHKLETRNLPLLDCMPVSKHEVQPKPMCRVSRGILLVFCVLRFINHTQLQPAPAHA